MPPIILYVPGVGDDISIMRTVAQFFFWAWRRYGFAGEEFRANWDDHQPFEPKFERLLTRIDALAQDHIVYLLGVSAGGSAALNAFSMREDKVARAAIVAGRLRRGNARPTLEGAYSTSRAYVESVLQFEEYTEPALTPELRDRILTMRPMSDGIVPTSTVPLEGATNLKIILHGHRMTCILAPFFYASTICRFFMASK